MSFTFNAVELCVVIINEKRWTRAREVCKALEYDAKTSKTANIIRGHCSPENITQKCQMSRVHAACAPINWPIGERICKNSIFTLMRKGCMSCYYQVNNQRQKTSKDIAAMCCCLMSGCSLQTK